MSEWDHRSVGFAATAFAVVLLTGCGTTEADLIDREDAQAVLIDNKSQALQVEQALDRVARVCMEAEGFEVQPPEPVYEEQYDEFDLLGDQVYTEPDLSLPPLEIYGLAVDDPAITVGVVDDSNEISYVDSDPFTEMDQTYRDDYFAAFYGEPEFETISLPDAGETDRAGGGCMRSAEDALSNDDYPGYLNHAALAGAKGGTAWDEDDRVTEARSLWAECMREREFDYESPREVGVVLFDAAGDLKSQWLVDQTISLEEAEAELAELALTAAEADAACHEESGLQQVQEEVYWEYIIAYVSQHEEEFYAFHQRTQDMLITAQEIIAAGRL